MSLLSSGKKTWKPLVELDHCHSDLINAVAISPDGEYLVSVSQDDTLKTWRCAEVLDKTNITPQSQDYFANNFDNRKWLSSLRPVFDHKQPHTFVIGSMEASRSFNLFSLGNSLDDMNHINSVVKYCDEVRSMLCVLCLVPRDRDVCSNGYKAYIYQ